MNIHFLEEFLGRFICQQNEIKSEVLVFIRYGGAKFLVSFTSGSEMLCWGFFCKLRAAVWADTYPYVSFLLLHFRTGNNL